MRVFEIVVRVISTCVWLVAAVVLLPFAAVGKLFREARR